MRKKRLITFNFFIKFITDFYYKKMYFNIVICKIIIQYFRSFFPSFFSGFSSTFAFYVDGDDDFDDDSVVKWGYWQNVNRVFLL